MANRPVYDHRHNPHTQIVMPKAKAEAIARVARFLGVSSHTVIQRAIVHYLSVFNEDL